MKKFTFLLLITLFCGVSIYSQQKPDKSTTSPINLNEIKTENRSSTSTEASTKIELTISGEENCCYEVYGINNTFNYTISLTGGVTWGRHWDVWVSDGIITAVDGLVNNCDPDHWWHYAGDANRSYVFTVNWDDNETGIGIIHANVSFQKIGLPITDSREAFLYPYIGKPATPAYVSTSNANPYIGQTISCTTNNVEGASSYIWGHTGGGSFNGSGTSVTYTPSTSGTQNINVRASNLCGTGYSRSTNINVQQYAPLDVYITGPHTASNSGYYDWIGHVSGGKPNYDYVWYYSYTGQSYTNLWATLYNSPNTTHTVHQSMPLDMDLYLKLVITDDLGNQKTAYFATLNTSMSPLNPDNTKDMIMPMLKDTDKITVGELENFAHECDIYPNPTTNEVNFPTSCFADYHSVVVYNYNGRIVMNKQEIPEKLDFSYLPDGIYFVVLFNQINNSNKVLKIIKN